MFAENYCVKSKEDKKAEKDAEKEEAEDVITEEKENENGEKKCFNMVYFGDFETFTKDD